MRPTERTYCSNGVDQACVADAMAWNKMATGIATLSAWDTYRCSMVQETDGAVEIPMTTPINFTIPAPDAPPPAFTPCSPPST